MKVWTSHGKFCGGADLQWKANLRSMQLKDWSVRELTLATALHTVGCFLQHIKIQHTFTRVAVNDAKHIFPRLKCLYILLSTKWYWEEITKKDGSVTFFFIYLICFTLVVAFVLVDNETDDDKLGSFSGILGAGWIWLGHKTSGRTFDR